MVKVGWVRKNGRKWVRFDVGEDFPCNRVQVGFDEWRRFILVCNKWVGSFGGYWVNSGRFDVPWDGFWRVVFESGWGDYFRGLWFGGSLVGELVDFGGGRFGVVVDGVSLFGDGVGGVVRWFKPLWVGRRSRRGKSLGRFELVPNGDGVRIVGFVPFSSFCISEVGGGFRVVDGDCVRGGFIPWWVLDGFGGEFVSVLRGGGRVWGDVSVDLVFRVSGFVFG